MVLPRPLARPLLAVQISLLFGLAAAVAATGQRRAWQHLPTCADVVEPLDSISGELRGLLNLLQYHSSGRRSDLIQKLDRNKSATADVSSKSLGPKKGSPEDTGKSSTADGPKKGTASAEDTGKSSAADGGVVPGEPWKAPLAPSELDRTEEVEDETFRERVQSWFEEETSTPEPQLPKFVGSTPLPKVPPPAPPPPYGTYNVPTKPPEAPVMMHPLKPQKAGNATEALKEKASRDCLLAAWGPWSACEQAVEGLPGQLQRRKREVLNPQRPGGQPCNVTITTRRCD